MMDLSQLQIGVVGASLAGLSVANVLERAGAAVTLFERGGASFAGRGGGLGLSLELARAVTGDPEGCPPHLVYGRRRVWTAGREWEEPTGITVTTYGALWRWLRDHLRTTPVHHDRHVVAVAETGADAWVTTAGARTERFDLVVAADGGGSGLRHLVEGDGHDRVFAGYVLWRGLVPTASLDDARFDIARRFHVANRGNHHFVAYAIPGHDGRAGVEGRLLNWGWYHPVHEADLAELLGESKLSAPHVLERNHEVHALFAEVERRDRGRWPDWVRHILERSRAEGAVAPHPVFELVPGRLVRGRVALAGDAAHLASPITGSGARMAMEDALTLGAALAAASSIEDALAAYGQARRSDAAHVVRDGQRWGAAFRAAAER
jgi:2-polyprenyl-6-methoxyphenol hydroxylase-like FAD-dependent oxidoreductase